MKNEPSSFQDTLWHWIKPLLKIHYFKSHFINHTVELIIYQNNSPFSFTFRNMEVQNQLQARERWQTVRSEQEETTPQWLRWCLYSNQSANCQVIISGYGCFLTSFVKWRWFSRSSLVQKVNRDDFCATLSVPLSCTFIGPGSCDTRPGPFQEGDGRVCWLPSRPLGIKDG